MFKKNNHTTPKDEVEYKAIPPINGKFPHIYRRGFPRTQISIRLPDPVLNELDQLCETYGLDRWAAINLALMNFKSNPPS